MRSIAKLGLADLEYSLAEIIPNERLQPIAPVAGLPMQVHEADNNQVFTPHHVNHAVWKTTHPAPTNVSGYQCPGIWKQLNVLKQSPKVTDKVVAQV